MDDFVKQLSESISRDTGQLGKSQVRSIKLAAVQLPSAAARRNFTFNFCQHTNISLSEPRRRHCWTVSQKLISVPVELSRALRQHRRATERAMDVELDDRASIFHGSRDATLFPSSFGLYLNISLKHSKHPRMSARYASRKGKYAEIQNSLQLFRYIVTHAIAPTSLLSIIARDTKDPSDNSAPGTIRRYFSGDPPRDRLSHCRRPSRSPCRWIHPREGISIRESDTWWEDRSRGGREIHLTRGGSRNRRDGRRVGSRLALLVRAHVYAITNVPPT